jgi:hypothetical protein
MFCPSCGAAEQSAETYCRNCGTFLPNFDKPGRRRHTPPEEHIKATTVLTLLSATVSIILAVILFSVFLGKSDTPTIIYVTAGFLTAIFAWQIQTFWRAMLLRKHFQKKNLQANDLNTAPVSFESASTAKLLDEPNLEGSVQPSVTEGTTRQFGEKIPRGSPQTKH